MTRKNFYIASGRTGIALAVAATMLLGMAAISNAEEQSTLARGGRLYDKWSLLSEAPTPKTRHPAYPATAKLADKGAATWRCKECHGWDYRGVDGAYGSGSHHTGIKGIAGMNGADPAAVAAVLRDATHGYGNLLNDADIHALALFVSRGQVDMNRWIDRQTKAVRGNPERGAAYYNTLCAQCHGEDGKKIKEMPPMGQVTGKNPWEALHKILNGQPDEEMPALRALDIQVAVDILSHAVTLPKEK